MKCLKAEKQKRGIETTSIILSDDGETSNDSYRTEVVQPQSPQITSRPPVIAENAQDPDTDIAITTERAQEPFLKTALAQLKNYKTKGNIQMLSESELTYVKKLFQQKNSDFWKEHSNIKDLHRHCKFTIRKLARYMAGLETLNFFQSTKEVNRENTQTLIYRCEQMFAAKMDAEKIFRFVSIAILDES